MQKCPKCGQNNPDDLSRCIKCKTSLRRPSSTAKTPVKERLKYIVVMAAALIIMGITFALSEVFPKLNGITVVRYLMTSILVIAGIFFALGALQFFNSRKG